MKKTIALLTATLLIFTLTACGGSSISSRNTNSGSVSSADSGNGSSPYRGDNARIDASPSSETESSDKKPAPSSKPSEKAPDKIQEQSAEQSREKSFGDLIEFDDLQIVFGNEIIWTAVNNRYSDKDGKDVFLVPVTVKNIKDETHGLNMFYYTQYGSKGTRLDSVGFYFDGEITSAGDMRPGAVQESVMAFLYDGDGDYYIELSTLFGRATEVKLPIIWGDESASLLSDNPVNLTLSSALSASAGTRSYGDLIEFDDLEIVFGSEITWTAVSNRYSDKDGLDVFLVPVTVKNIKGETYGLNMFYYTQYGSQGTKLDSVGFYFDGEISSAGDMRSGATQESVMAFLYDGDGDYYVEFSTLFGSAIEVRLPIEK